MDTSNPVRDGAQTVMKKASHVSVNETNIPEFATELADQYEFHMPSWDAPVFPSQETQSLENTIRFFLVTNALNYCFDDLETGTTYATTYNGQVWEGAYGMFAAVRRAMDEGISILSPEYLRTITTADVTEVFRPVSVDRSMPLLESRGEQLRAIGEFMTTNPDFISESFRDETPIYGKEGVVETLVSSPAYEDTRTYRGAQIRFDKRAQLFVSSLYGHLHGTADEFTIPDIDSFTVFADYGIPAVLADHEVLSYSDALETRILAGNEIPENSETEVEIRAATVVAGDRILTALQDLQNQSLTVPVLDHILWRTHHDISFPTHRTATTAY